MEVATAATAQKNEADATKSTCEQQVIESFVDLENGLHVQDLGLEKEVERGQGLEKEAPRGVDVEVAPREEAVLKPGTLKLQEAPAAPREQDAAGPSLESGASEPRAEPTWIQQDAAEPSLESGASKPCAESSLTQPLLAGEPPPQEAKLPRRKQNGFSIEDRVLMEVRVVGFNGNNVVVESKTAQGIPSRAEYKPEQLIREVWPAMMTVLQCFCGKLDIWFLRETFAPVRPSVPPKDAGERGSTSTSPGMCHGCLASLSVPGEFEREIQDRVEKEAAMIFYELNMAPWEMDEVPPLVSYTFGLYLRRVLAPSVFFCRAHAAWVQWTLGCVLVVMVLHSLWGFSQLRTDYTDEEALANGARAFRAVEHAPLTPLVLLLCTHLIMVIFGSRAVEELFSMARHLPFPLTYPVVVGKAFMVLRMVMAYSSANLGLSIDYFVWQELLLTATHGLLALLVGDPSAEHSGGGSFSKRLARACMTILGIDTFKTVVMLVFWCNFKEGRIAYCFNRLPSISVQLSASVLVHAVLDLVQTFVSVFTMFIGRAFVAFTSGEKHNTKPEAVPEEEVPPAVKELLGTWNSTSGDLIRFQLKSWELPVPEGVTESFEYPTRYDPSGLAATKMVVRVPKDLKAGEKFSVKEVRFCTRTMGERSFDASALVLPDGKIPLFSSDYARLDTSDKVLKLEFFDAVTNEKLPWRCWYKLAETGGAASSSAGS